MGYSTFMLNKISSTRFLKLYTLACMINKNGDVYGKEVLDYINSFNSAWQPSHGTLYPVLKDMISEELIVPAPEFDGKKYYSITEKGRTYYNARSASFRDMLLRSADLYKSIAESLPVAPVNTDELSVDNDNATLKSVK